MQKLLTIVGPTAVGKTSIGIHLAKTFHGEIVSADSMQIYQGMDVGTAKASVEERQRIPHHLIDVVPPDAPFSVQEFQRHAHEAILDIRGRGHLPIVVGGTGLYIEAVIHGYQPPPVSKDPKLREHFQQIAEQKGKNFLHQCLAEVDPDAAKKIHSNDVKRIIRALEVYELTGKPFSAWGQKQPSQDHVLWIGLTMPREQLYDRINHRVDQMIADGWLDEVKTLHQQGYHASYPSMKAIGYRELLQVIEGERSLEEAIVAIKKGTRNYAKRQLTWFRRLSDIHWFDVTKNEVYKEIQRFVAGKFIISRE